MSGVSVEAVETKAQRDAFIKVPWAIYGEDPAWVPPLLMERRDHLNPEKNPLFRRTEVALWVAKRDGKAVGRISAQRNEAHLERYHDATGQFGLLEGIDDPAVFKALFDTAEAWLRERGLKRAQGPFSLSINEESGLLVEGYETPPYILMGHARPYYADRVEALGYAKAMDLVAYYYDVTQSMPPRLEKLIEKTMQRKGLTIRWLDKARYQQDLRTITEIFNDAWADNWNFLPFTEADARHMAESMKQLIEPGHVAIAEINGEAVAMCVTLPNINEAITDLDGRLVPFGWAKLLWRLKVRTPRSGRMALMGVRRAYHETPMGAVLAYGVIESVRAYNRGRGVLHGELSWVLEDNKSVRHIVETSGGRVHKTYRVYEKTL